ncbi:RNA polymerase sigma factor [Haliangium sp.]|uniref:RNA polymerase sigma factor n=1 Tax=Haliangium sp. TaxID=2663208 RepID=UPI003D0D8C12
MRAPTADTDDVTLLERWRDGDRLAGAALFERYYDAVERFFVNKVSMGVGDLVQETFKGCIEARDRVRDPGKFRSFLFSIAYNVFRNYLRAKRREGDQVDIDQVAMATLSPGPRSIAMEQESDEERLLLEGLRAIPAQYQVILELHYWEDLTTTEMAEVLGTSRGTVNGLLQRARKKLTVVLRELAESPEVLRSTLDDIDGWAARWRDQIERPHAPAGDDEG